MSGATTELNLATAVDSDDNADYLTLSLANSLRTVDALFNNVSGHTHGGAHQGGAIASIPASAIPPNSITSAMIVDGTITFADLAAGAAQAQLAQYFAVPSFSSTTTGSWLATPVSVVATGGGGLLRIDMFTTLAHSVAGSIILATIGINGTTSLGGLAQITSPGSGYSVPLSFTLYQPMSAGANGFALYLYNNNAGTLSIGASVASFLSVTEQRR